MALALARIGWSDGSKMFHNFVRFVFVNSNSSKWYHHFNQWKAILFFVFFSLSLFFFKNMHRHRHRAAHTLIEYVSQIQYIYASASVCSCASLKVTKKKNNIGSYIYLIKLSKRWTYIYRKKKKRFVFCKRRDIIIVSEHFLGRKIRIELCVRFWRLEM